MVNLQQRVAIVTGGGTGIGRAIASALAQHDATVVVTGRRPQPLAETVARIERAGGRARAVELDVTDAAAVDRAFDGVVNELGSVHVLVNNAGLGGPNGCALPGEDRWDEIVRTNLDGVFFCSRAAARHLPRGGRIVNISSVLGRFGVPGYTAYCASKHGVIGFTRALALELAPRGITVNALCPGWVETEMAKRGMELLAEATGTDYPQARASALAQVPIGRIIQPEEVAELVLYVVSEAAAAMTGQAVSLCGGATMV